MSQSVKTKLQYRTDLLVEFLSDLMFQGVNFNFYPCCIWTYAIIKRMDAR
ncbi:hypothetical protein LR68_01747 [Anoxybacillus sp. BCO1]|nr:hypothetical protein LR68_01747 [Anoxybacillus sp. BCO1]